VTAVLESLDQLIEAAAQCGSSRGTAEQAAKTTWGFSPTRRSKLSAALSPPALVLEGGRGPFPAGARRPRFLAGAL
jgi:hypothetical protein